MPLTIHASPNTVRLKWNAMTWNLTFCKFVKENDFVNMGCLVRKGLKLTSHPHIIFFTSARQRVRSNFWSRFYGSMVKRSYYILLHFSFWLDSTMHTKHKKWMWCFLTPAMFLWTRHNKIMNIKINGALPRKHNHGDWFTAGKYCKIQHKILLYGKKHTLHKYTNVSR